MGGGSEKTEMGSESERGREQIEREREREQARHDCIAVFGQICV